MKLLVVVWRSEIDNTDRLHESDIMAHRRNIKQLLFVHVCQDLMKRHYITLLWSLLPKVILINP